MKPEQRIPLEAMMDKGGLWVPRQLSQATATRLVIMGLAQVAETTYSRRGLSKRERLVVTDKGIEALQAGTR